MTRRLRRRLRYRIALWLVPEMAVYARPSSRLFARATLDSMASESRYIDADTRTVLSRISATG